mgnify:CR=1 FL=1
MMKVNKLKYSSFSEYVFKINYGYLNNEGKIVPDKFINPTAEYHLQTPYELTKNEYGICFDIVELSRDYFNSRNILCESYYMEYKKDDIFESYAFLIYKRKNNLWYECPDNSWADLVRTKGYFDKEVLIKNVYDWFQGWIYKEYQKIAGKGLSIYYIIECVGAIVITYIYNWNAYAAYWVSFGVVVFGFLYTFLFKEPNKFQETNITINSKIENNQQKKQSKKPDSYLKILSSGFFLSLLAYAMIIRGVLSIFILSPYP